MDNLKGFSGFAEPDADRQEGFERPERDFPAVLPGQRDARGPLVPDELDALPADDDI